MTIDLTGIAVAATGGIFSTLGIVLLAIIQAKIKNQQARDVLSAAIGNSLGAMQKAATSEIQVLHPQIAGVPDSLAPGVRYVLDQAGSEAESLGVTPASIAAKIEAKLGLQNILTNLATTANATPTVVAPLAQVAPVI